MSLCKTQPLLPERHLYKSIEIPDEYERFKHAISVQIGHVIGQDITNIIAEFCKGYAITCCNTHCDNVICINNKSEWENSLDSEGNNIHKYQVFEEINKLHLSHDYKTYCLFGKQGRVFCVNCTKNEIQQCKFVKYNTYTYLVDCNNYDTDNLCVLHINRICKKGGRCKFQEKAFDVRHYRRNDHDPIKQKLICKNCYPNPFNEVNKIRHLLPVYLPGWEFWDSDYDMFFDSDGYISKQKLYKFSDEWFEQCVDDGTSFTDDGDELSMDHSNTQKGYNLSKYGYKCTYNGDEISKKKKIGLSRRKRFRERKSYKKRREDKRSNAKSKRKFKSQCLLSTQY